MGYCIRLRFHVIPLLLTKPFHILQISPEIYQDLYGLKVVVAGCAIPVGMKIEMGLIRDRPTSPTKKQRKPLK